MTTSPTQTEITGQMSGLGTLSKLKVYGEKVPVSLLNFEI
jgi:hypothetical protein